MNHWKTLACVVLILTLLSVPLSAQDTLKTIKIFTAEQMTERACWAVQSIKFEEQEESYNMVVRMENEESLSFYVREIEHIVFDDSVLVEDGVKNDKVIKIIPSKFGIAGNYPNPFNGGTTITYVLDHPGEVTLRVRDLAGREIITLVSGAHTAGQFNANWDGTDSWGIPVPTGIYFCTVAFDGKVAAQRMLVLR